MLTLKALLDILHEPNAWLFELIWAEFTAAELQGVLDEIVQIVRSGGEKTWDKTRLRSDGGIFLRVLRDQFRDRMDPILKQQQAMRRAKQHERVQAAAQCVSECVQDLFCPPPVLGQFIGKAGSSVAALRKQTDCRIVVDPTGKISVDGENAQEARKAIRVRIYELIQKSHNPYAEQVALSELMLRDRDEIQEPWAQALYAWVAEAVERTPACDMPRVLAMMVPMAPQEVRAEVRKKLQASPMILGGKSAAVSAILHAVEACELELQATCADVSGAVDALAKDMATQLECA